MTFALLLILFLAVAGVASVALLASLCKTPKKAAPYNGPVVAYGDKPFSDGTVRRFCYGRFDNETAAEGYIHNLVAKGCFGEHTFHIVPVQPRHGTS